MAGRVAQWVEADCWVWFLALTLVTHTVEEEGLLYTLPSGLWYLPPYMDPSIRVNVIKNRREENTKLPTTCTYSVSDKLKNLGQKLVKLQKPRVLGSVVEKANVKIILLVLLDYSLS